MRVKNPLKTIYKIEMLGYVMCIWSGMALYIYQVGHWGT